MINRSVVSATDGVLLPLDDLAMSVDSSVAGTVTCTIVYCGNTYRQTVVTAGAVVTVGQWVKV
jgi:hypothetical protein